MKGTAITLLCAFAVALSEEEVKLNAEGCPLDPTIFKVLPDEVYCNLFHTCESGKRMVQKCPHGLVFNKELDVCDWKQNVDCEERKIYEFALPEDGESNEKEDNPGGNNDPSLAPQICARDNSSGVLVAHENCTQFYKCDRGVPVTKDCPEGLLYNSELGYCDWPTNVNCGDRTRPEIIEAVLPGAMDDKEDVYEACAKDDTNELLLAHETCNRFYKCSHGLPVALSCPSGLVYNIELHVCDWQTNVECGDRPIVEDEKEEEDINGDSNSNEDSYGGNGHCDPSEAPAICAADKSDGVLVAHENCNQFYKCSQGEPVTLDCPHNLLYNPEKEICDWPENVDCGTRV